MEVQMELTKMVRALNLNLTTIGYQQRRFEQYLKLETNLKAK